MMRKFNRRIVLGLVLASVAGLSLAVWAGPVLPGQRKVPAEIQALAGLRQFRTEVGSLLARPAEVSVTRDFVLREMRTRLTDRGVELVEAEDRDRPLITLDLVFGTDPAQPKALSITVVLTQLQKVTIDRLDRNLLLPTSTFVLTEVTTMDNAEETIKFLIRSSTGGFARALKLANAAPQTARRTPADAGS